MIQLNEADSKKFVKYFISCIKALKNGDNVADECNVILDKGNFYFECKERVPQLVRGKFKFVPIKKKGAKGKDLNSENLKPKDIEQMNSINNVLENFSSVFSIKEILDFDKSLVGNVCTKVHINDNGDLIVNFESKPPKKDDPNFDSFVPDKYEFELLGSNKTIEDKYGTPINIIKYEDKSIFNDLFDTTLPFNFNFDENLSLNISQNLIIGIKNNHCIESFNLYSEDDEVAIVSIKTEIDERYFNLEKSGNTILEAESFYRIVKWQKV